MRDKWQYEYTSAVKEKERKLKSPQIIRGYKIKMINEKTVAVK